jgi:nucleotidyltransferase substrate binding protein (TIGR01987 family)
MEELKLKKENILSALKSLDKAIVSYKKALQKIDISSLLNENVFEEYEDFVRTLRDSLIQRFEYSVDMFWKYLKFYLENIEKLTLETKSPKGIVRAVCQARLMREDDAKLILEMIDYRNRTSHIYKEETADIISKHIPDFYLLIKKIVDSLKIK